MGDMNNRIIVATLALCLLVPSAVSASTVVRSGDTISVTENQVVDGSFYALGGAVALSGEIKGDAVVLGGTVTLNGDMTDDLLVIGGAVNMSASGTEDVRILGGDVTISKPISGDLVVVGGRVTVLSTASVKGDVLLYGEDATIDGDVGGQVIGNVRNLRINSKVGKGIDITTRSLTLGDQADVTGDIQYASQNELVRSPNSVVTGKVMQGAPDTTASEDSAAALRQLVILFLMSLFATLSLYLIARRFVEFTAGQAVHHFGIKTLVGFATCILVPAMAGILFMSMLGILVGAVALALFVVAIVIALALMNAVAGALILKVMKKKTPLSVPYIIAGAVVVHLSLLVPVVGTIALTFVFLATVGTLVVAVYQRLLLR